VKVSRGGVVIQGPLVFLQGLIQLPVLLIHLAQEEVVVGIGFGPRPDNALVPGKRPG